MKYICQICGYVYDDAKEKVPFAELPDDWKCPLCGAAKSDFKPEANGDEKKVVTAIGANGSRFGEAFSRTTGSTLFQSCQRL